MDIETIIAPQIGQALVLAPFVVGLVGAVKAVGLQSRFAPLASLGIGVGLALLLNAHPLVGIIAGLSASGLYSGVKATVGSPSPVI